MKKATGIILILIWMAVIFMFSNMNTNVSNSNSKKAISEVLTVSLKNINAKTDINKMTNELNLPLRKVMHSLVFFILSMLMICVMSIYKIDLKKSILMTFTLCLIYACTDEFHQLFVSGRTGSIRDVIIDMMGSISALIIYYYCMKGKYYEKT